LLVFGFRASNFEIVLIEVSMPRGAERRRGGSAGPKRDLFDITVDPLAFERSARAAGHRLIAGIDEAGRGPLAGPVVAAAAILPDGLVIPGVNDSKLVTECERERLHDIIREKALSFGIGIVDAATIDAVNILQATLIAMERAVAALSPQPDLLLIDALTLPRCPIPQNGIIKGDRRSHSIAAASILAKVTRDRLMCELHELFPQYNFKGHKGYGTKEHMALIRQHGPCEAHRRSFRPISTMEAGAGR
jgi:ribonuclease HII